MSTHETVRFGYHGEEYPIRINYFMDGGKPVHTMIEQYTSIGLDEEAWEEYHSETDKEVEQWNREIMNKD